VEQDRVLDHRVDVAVVLIRAGGGPHLDAADAGLRREAVRVLVEPLEGADPSAVRPVQAVAGRLRDPVEALVSTLAPADHGKDGAAGVTELVRRLDDDVGDDVGEEASLPAEGGALAAVARRQVDVPERPAGVGGAEEAGAG